ncbi:hypothetical protein HY450_02950 [Candidatus Pacearchaeota archaeon]|nr:hypothetical protein [Candidatus Pacearchaeota archaeon]
MRKIRVNITVDEKLVKEAKKKLNLFGGKLSTLFNSYLDDFVSSADKIPGDEQKKLIEKIADLERRIKDLEKRG